MTFIVQLRRPKDDSEIERLAQLKQLNRGREVISMTTSIDAEPVILDDGKECNPFDLVHGLAPEIPLRFEVTKAVIDNPGSKDG